MDAKALAARSRVSLSPKRTGAERTLGSWRDCLKAAVEHNLHHRQQHTRRDPGRPVGVAIAKGVFKEGRVVVVERIRVDVRPAQRLSCRRPAPSFQTSTKPRGRRICRMATGRLQQTAHPCSCALTALHHVVTVLS